MTNTTHVILSGAPRRGVQSKDPPTSPESAEINPVTRFRGSFDSLTPFARSG